jgi:pimeloyl-ACP methyl ester carboxylesterase
VQVKQTQHSIVSGQFRTHLVEAGQEGAAVLFLIHDGGLGADSKVSWNDVITELQSDFHIFAIDLYGFGQSDMLFHFGRRPYESHIEQIADVVRAIGIKAAHFVGTSYGGSVVLRAAAQSPRPWPMLSGVSVSGTGGVYRHEHGKRLLATTEPKRESLREFVKLLVSDDWSAIELNVEQRMQNAVRPGHWEALAAPRLRSPIDRHVSGETDRYPASLADCDVPLLLVEGAHDVLLEDDWAQRIAKHASLGRALRIDASHSPNLDNPSLIAEVLREFVRGIES